MWELHPLVTSVDFHYDEKIVQENPKTPYPLGFSPYVFLSLLIPPKKKNLSFKVGYPKHNINRIIKSHV